MFKKDTVKVKKLPILQRPTFEAMQCDVSNKKKTLSIIVLYRPPPSPANQLKTSDFFREFPDFLEELVMKPGQFIILGDLNFHMDVAEDNDARRFHDLLHSFDMHQHIKVPTHKFGHTLDVVITRSQDNDLIIPNSTFVRDPQLITNDGKPSKGHFAILFKLWFGVNRKTMTTLSYRNLKSIDIEAFKLDIQLSQLKDLPNISDVDVMMEMYNSTLTEIFDKHAPVVTRVVNYKPLARWYTSDITTEKRKRRRLERRLVKTDSQSDRVVYRKQCLTVNKFVCSAKSVYYSGEILTASGNKKELFKVARNLLGEDASSPLPIHDSSQDLATDFSVYFDSKIEKIHHEIAQQQIDANIPASHFEDPCVGSLRSFEPVSDDDIKDILKNVKITSCDLDPLPSSLFVKCSDILVPFITQIVNCSLLSGKFPTICKSAIIKPLLKKSNLDINVLKNYRPVSNLSFVGKIIERVVDHTLTDHLASLDLHDNFQSAYRPNHSTETALVRVQNDIMEALDKGNVVLLVLLDLSAAFDTVNHDLLLNRLQSSFGVVGPVLEWFASYLRDRSQCVKITSSTSQPTQLKYGVPQGSVLGPKLFCMYTRPLGKIVLHHNGVLYHIYADDTQLYIEIQSPIDSILPSKSLIENCISDIRLWMCNNYLKLNEQKTEVIYFASSHNLTRLRSMDLTISVGGNLIQPVPCVKNLGVYQDEALSMSEHTRQISNSCFRVIYSVNRIRPYLTEKACESLLQSLVITKLDYGNALLGGASQTVLRPFQRVQHVCARIIFKLRRRDHITPALLQLHWLPIPKRPDYKTALLVHKALRGKAPSYLRSLIVPRTSVRSSRRSMDTVLSVPKFRTERYGRARFSVLGPSIWNKLPNKLRRCESVPVFKKLLKSHLLETHYF